MVPPTRQQVVAGVVALVLTLGAIGAAMHRHRPPARAAAGPMSIGFDGPQRGGASKRAVVDVAGAVRRPGVYELPDGARVSDAIERAGGAIRGARLTGVNRAAPVVDGQQILVPVATPALGVPVANANSHAGGPVSINGASVDDLDALDGVGPVTAQKIVDDRTANGPFRSVDDLDRVPGIGPTTVEALRSDVTL